MKISGTMERIPQNDLRAHAEMNAFYIFPASVKQSVFNLFATHPPMEKRIAALSPPRGAAAGHAARWASSTRSSGRRKVKGPAPDRLFAITTAAITLEAEHGIKTRGAAAIVFQPLATGDFQRSSPRWRRSCGAPARRPARRSRPATTRSATAG